MPNELPGVLSAATHRSAGNSRPRTEDSETLRLINVKSTESQGLVLLWPQPRFQLRGRACVFPGKHCRVGLKSHLYRIGGLRQIANLLRVSVFQAMKWGYCFRVPSASQTALLANHLFTPNYPFFEIMKVKSCFWIIANDFSKL